MDDKDSHDGVGSRRRSWAGPANEPPERRRVRILLLVLAAVCLVVGPAGCVSGILSESFLDTTFQGGDDHSYRTNFAVGFVASVIPPAVCVVIAMAVRERIWAGLSALLYLWPAVIVILCYIAASLFDLVNSNLL